MELEASSRNSLLSLPLLFMRGLAPYPPYPLSPSFLYPHPSLVPSLRAASFGCRGFRMVGARGWQYAQGLAAGAVGKSMIAQAFLVPLGGLHLRSSAITGRHLSPCLPGLFDTCCGVTSGAEAGPSPADREGDVMGCAESAGTSHAATKTDNHKDAPSCYPRRTTANPLHDPLFSLRLIAHCANRL